MRREEEELKRKVAEQAEAEKQLHEATMHEPSLKFRGMRNSPAFAFKCRLLRRCLERNTTV